MTTSCQDQTVCGSEWIDYGRRNTGGGGVINPLHTGRLTLRETAPIKCATFTQISLTLSVRGSTFSRQNLTPVDVRF